MHRVTLARVREGHREVVVNRTLPLVQALRASRLVTHVESRRRRYVVCRRYLEMFLAVALLSRLEICEVKVGSLRVVEWDVVHTVCIGVVRARELEVGVLPAVEIIERHRRLPQPAERHIAHAVQIVWVVDAPVVYKRVDRHDLHTVQVAVDRPHEVGQRTYRVIEQIRLERPLYTARTCRVLLLLRLVVSSGIVWVDTAQGYILSVALRARQRRGVQLGGRRIRQQRQRRCRNGRYDPYVCATHLCLTLLPRTPAPDTARCRKGHS